MRQNVSKMYREICVKRTNAHTAPRGFHRFCATHTHTHTNTNFTHKHAHFTRTDNIIHCGIAKRVFKG